LTDWIVVKDEDEILNIDFRRRKITTLNINQVLVFIGTLEHICLLASMMR
jgi:hypothetical protein